jgi:integrase
VKKLPDTKSKDKAKSERGKGHLYKRDSKGREHPATHKGGVFCLEYRVGGKRFKTRLTDRDGNPITTRKEAEAERARITAPFAAKKEVDHLKAVVAKLTDAEQAHAQAVDEANPPLTIAEAWDAFIKSPKRKKKASPDMINHYAGHWVKFTRWLEENRPAARYLRDVQPDDAEIYFSGLEAVYQSGTFNKHLQLLRRMFDVLKKPAKIEENPFAEISRQELIQNSRREFTIAELKEILETATGDLQTLLFIGTFTGLRLGDCCTLKWQEVDLHRGLIKRIPNKTAKKKTPVLIGIPEALHVKLSETPPDRRKGFVLPRFAGLYLHRNAEGRLTRQAMITREVQAHLEACGIETIEPGTGPGTGKRAVVSAGFHSLRHSFVSLHAAAGTAQAVIQKIVGHANPAMTAHYTHVNEQTARDTTGALQLNEPTDHPARIVPGWIKEKLEGMTAANWEQIKAELTEKEG